VRAFAVSIALVLGACGGDSGPSLSPYGDAAVDLDAPMHPAAPVLGEQLDRAGRPQIRTLLVGVLDEEAPRAAKQEAYDRASDPARWATAVLDPAADPPTTIESELARSLALLDALDAGHAEVPAAGCGNVAGTDTPPSPASYAALARLLADDQLYIDTDKTVCEHYLALELATMLQVEPTSCGGRTLTHDAIDASYSLLFGGTAGFTPPPALAPRLGDGATAHDDVSDTAFPFLGPPR